MGKLAVPADLRHGGHPARGHAGLGEARLPGARVGGGERRDELLAERVCVLDPIREGGEARVVRKLRQAERAGERRELALRGRGDHQEAVAGREGVGGRVVGLRPVAVRPGLLPVHLPEGDCGGHDADRGVEHGKVEMVALAGALAVVERGRDGETGLRGGRHVGQPVPGLERLGAGRAGDRHHAGGRLDGGVVGGGGRARPGLPVTGYGAIDEARIDLLQRLVAEAHAVHRPGLEVLDEDIGGCRQPAHDPGRAGMLEVEGEGPLAGIDREEQRGHGMVEKAGVRGGAEASALVAAGAVLYLHHIRAEQRQLLGAVGAGKHLGEIDDAHPLQRPPRRFAPRFTGGVLRPGHAASPFIAGIRYIYPLHPLERRPGP